MVGRTQPFATDEYGTLVAQAGARRTAAKAAALQAYGAAMAESERLVKFDERLQRHVGDIEQRRALRTAGKLKAEAFHAAEVQYQQDMMDARSTAKANGDNRVHW